MLHPRSFLLVIALLVAPAVFTGCEAHRLASKGAVMIAPVHASVRVNFEIDGRKFEAVGFLRRGEWNILGEEMLRRVPDAIGEEDWAFLVQRLGKLPPELNPYTLVTARRYPDEPGSVSYFFRICGGWVDDWRWLSNDWYDYHLVVRRRA